MSGPIGNLVSMKDMLDNGKKSSKLVPLLSSLFSANSFSTLFYSRLHFSRNYPKIVA